MIRFGLILVTGLLFFASCASHKNRDTVEVKDKTTVSEPEKKQYSVSNEIDGKKLVVPKGKTATEIGSKTAVAVPASGMEKKVITKKPQKVNK